MNLRNIDGTSVNLTKGSHKKILFDCDTCGITVEQSYKNYVKQNDGKFCRKCRNKHTANRADVKEKQSISSKERWLDDEYRKSISYKLSIACKDSWDSNNGKIRKSVLSINNPMYNKCIVEKVREKLTENVNTIKNYLSSIGYTYIRHNKDKCKVIVTYRCNNGHLSEQRLNDLRSGHRCNECFGSFSMSEKEIVSYIKSIYDGEIIENDRTTVFNEETNRYLELDIYLPDIQKAIEFNGEFWHNKEPAKKNDLLKQRVCSEKNLDLLVVWFSEWQNDKNKCLEKIKNWIIVK